MLLIYPGPEFSWRRVGEEKVLDVVQPVRQQCRHVLTGFGRGFKPGHDARDFNFGETEVVGLGGAFLSGKGKCPIPEMRK